MITVIATICPTDHFCETRPYRRTPVFAFTDAHVAELKQLPAVKFQCLVESLIPEEWMLLSAAQ